MAPPLPWPTALEAAQNSLQQRLSEAVLELDAARVAKGQAEVDFEVGRGHEGRAARGRAGLPCWGIEGWSWAARLLC